MDTLHGLRRQTDNYFLVSGLDLALNVCLQYRSDFGCFVTCGARDPDLPRFARKIAEAL